MCGTGHITKHCPSTLNNQHTYDNPDNNASDYSQINSKFVPNINNTTPEENNTIDITSQLINNLQNISQDSVDNLSLSDFESPQPNAMPPPSTTAKRPLSSSSSSIILAKNNKEVSKVKSEDKITQATKKAKKPRKNISIDQIAEQLEPIKNSLTNDTQNFPLSFEKLSKFLQVSYDNTNIKDTALEYTDDLPALSTVLRTVLEMTSIGNLKSRINRIIKRLENSTNYSSSSEASNFNEF